MKAKVLVLEDSPARISMFSNNLKNASITFAKRADEAITYLANEVFHFLYLDHDLGNTGNPGTGYDVACWLEEHPDRKPGKIIVHSSNTVGVPKILAALPEAYHLPLAWMIETELSVPK